MRNFLRKFLPHHDTVKNNRWLKPFGNWLQKPDLWHLHRRQVAGGVAVGLFCGLIPGPLQMLVATLMAVLLRVNLPVALFATLYTNPFTIVPLYMLAYRLGAWVSGTELPVPSLALVYAAGWRGWLAQLGKPLLIGLPLLAVCFSVTGYVFVRIAWRVAVILKWRSRKRRREG
jgi:uncharacterized protein (DUF2062 family)